ncbi:type I polyketide synthase [Streptomyces sp. NPDC087659]|uniref:type I polyketide synthase n=1 Tax=Streptomyces sp. NPDC087659 TaxID=3365801 RepID=UPI0037FDC9D7
MTTPHDLPHAADGIAVVGLSCRLPRASGPGDFWDMLLAGRDGITAEPPVGVRHEGWPAAGKDIPPGGYVESADTFDAEFFGVGEHEAREMDPQQRLTLELGWEALEDAAVLPSALRGQDVGVFVGVASDDYALLSRCRDSRSIDHHTMTGVQRGVVANRLSRVLGIGGPSLTVDTGQSSSLVAVHLACESLRRGEIRSALVGGVHLNLHPEGSLPAQQLGVLSPDGRCYAFDERANGYVRGEGGGFLYLKPLGTALADGDRVYCVLLGNAVNNDGTAGRELGVPDHGAQREVIRLAQRKAGVTAADIDYVELHGTGTRAGDAAEARALGEVFAAGRDADRPLLVGSAKTNVGHLEAAAGITGLIKVALAMRHERIPASLNHHTPAADVPLDQWRLQVVSQDSVAWPAPTTARLAGVSSFGIGGTNCHLVVASAPTRSTPSVAPLEPDTVTSGASVWTLSGRTQAALRAQAARLVAHPLDSRTGGDPRAVGRALAGTRTAFRHRAAVVATDVDGLRAGVAQIAADGAAQNVLLGYAEDFEQVVFVFPGQGTQWAGMALRLAEESDVFRRALRQCATALAPHVDWDLRHVLSSQTELERADVVQPALWAVMISLSELWEHLGVGPSAVIGHSQGEIAAACAAGVLSLDEGARLVTTRSRLVARHLSGKGAMASLPLSEAAATSLISPWRSRLDIAAVNGPESVVVSGDPAALDELAAVSMRNGAGMRRLAVDYASHSHLVTPLRERLVAGLGHIRTQVTPATRPAFISSVTGERADAEALSAEYWFRNLAQPVRFATAVRTALAGKRTAFVEMSPHPVLIPAIVATAEESGADCLAVGALRRGEGGYDQVLRSVAALYVRGVDIDWRRALPGPGTGHIDLPTYAFQRESFWLTSADSAPMSRRRADAAYVPAAVKAGTGDEPSPGQPAGTEAIASRVRTEMEAVARSRAMTDTMGPETDERPFRDLGFSSLMLVELAHRLRVRTGARVTTTTLLSYPNVAALARHLADGDERDRPIRTAVPAEGSGGPADPTGPDDPIVIVGMSCRYPGGVTSAEDLWHLTLAGADAISDFPTDRGWDLEALQGSGSGSSMSQSGGFLYQAAEFDAEFFGISPREALAMDPQQRLLLETAWDTLEHAGIAPASVRGTRTGVFVGAISQDYGPAWHRGGAGVEGHLLTGTTESVLSGRIAYTFGFEGPAVTIDTACSSSLVAMHMAAQSLRAGDCELALAGGVTVMAAPGLLVEFSRQGGLAVDGRCRSYAESASGTGWAEGVGLLALERLSRARAAGHHVLAVLRGSAVNQDGASNGLSAPNGVAQQRVIRAALDAAALSPADVDVVEGHGTGTRLGDPVEAQAILATYGQDRDQALLLGSVKSNIGHSQAASGVAGVIKMTYAMRHGVVPATLHVDAPSSRIDWDEGAVEVVTSRTAWPDTGRGRRCAVSSFGISGTNAHVILESPPPVAASLPAPGEGPQPYAPVHDPQQDAETAPVTLLLSGRTPMAVREQAEQLAARLAEDRPPSLHDTAFTLATRRTALEYRSEVRASGRQEAERALLALAREHPEAVPVVSGAPGSLAVLFTGQGAQHNGMGRELYGRFPVFRNVVDEICDAFEGLLELPLREVMFASSETHEGDALHRTEYAQPALFAVETALYRTMNSLGVEPDYLAGHSVGEITAAHVAGVLSLQDACTLVAARGRLMQQLPEGGAMTAVRATEEEVRPLLDGREDRVCLAAVNGPSAIVLSGDADTVAEVAGHFRGLGRPVRPLRVSHAFHSAHMEPMLEAFGAVLETLTFRQPTKAVVSGVTGTLATAEQLCSPHYWAEHVRHTVRFGDAVSHLVREGVGLYLELGPDAVLSGILSETAPDGAVVVATQRRTRHEPTALAEALSRLHTHQVAVDWSAYYAGSGAVPVDLPGYAFARTRYWARADAGVSSLADTGLTAVGHPLLSAAAELPDSGGYVFSGVLSTQTQPWLADHVVHGLVVVPGTALMDLVLHVAEKVGCAGVTELTLESPLVVPEQRNLPIRVVVGARDDSGSRTFSLWDGGPADGDVTWSRRAQGVLGPALPWPDDARASFTVEEIQRAAPDFYDRVQQAGFGYGPVFQGLQRVARTGQDILTTVVLPEPARTDLESFGVHPALLDAALQAVLAADDSAVRPMLPFSCSGVRLYRPGSTELRVRLRAIGKDTFSLLAADPSGAPVISIAALHFRPVAPGQLADAGHDQDTLLAVRWIPVPEEEHRQEGAPSDSWAVLAGTDLPGIRRLSWEELAEATDVPAVVVAPLGHDTSPGTEDGADKVHDASLEALLLTQRWVSDPRLAGSLLVVVTRNGVAAPGRAPDCAAAAVRGLVRAAQREQPGRFRLLDIDTGPLETEPVAALLACAEPDALWRDGSLSVPRLARLDEQDLSVPAGEEPWHLAVPVRGDIDGVTIRPFAEAGRPLGPDEVRIAVRAGGVNFRDVLNALDMYPGEAGPLGLEVAGVVLETGSEVSRVATGDRVFGLVPGALGPVAVADSRLLSPMPEGWSFAAASGVPVVFLTACYGLVELAAVRPGERVLIHSGAGGVGMAAIQLALHLGCEVYATASPAKWDALRRLGVPDHRIASSRTLEFEEKFRSATHGHGMDVVLNSLAGEFVDASLRLLADGGRFLEIGKTDLRDPAATAARFPGTTYTPFDLLDQQPAVVSRLLDDMLGLFAQDALTPLPVTAWDVRRAREAFRYLGNARHTGKVILTVPSSPDPHGTVLITGGTGGLGQEVARHMVRAYGARHLLLLSRRGPDAVGAAELRDELVAAGARVAIHACDVADRDALAAALASIPPEHPLTAVVHTAGVLDDGTLNTLDADRLARVLGPKADAAVHLHELTAADDLALFVLFSSVAGALGTAGQANYAAANAALDALAEHRRVNGLPGVSLAWGAWSQERGMTAHLTGADILRLARTAIAPLPTDAGLALLDEGIDSPRAHAVACRLDTAALSTADDVPHLLRGLRPQGRRTQAPRTESLARRLRHLTATERLETVTGVVKAEVAAVLGHATPDAIDVQRALADMGLDSLTSVELRNRLSALAGARFPATLVFDHPSVGALAREVLSVVTAQEPGGETAQEPGGAGQFAPASAVAPAAPVRPADSDDDPVVIVGMACRYPGGVRSPEELWRLVDDGVDAVAGFPRDRGWDLAGLFGDAPGHTGTVAAREGAFLHDAADFDASFFAISPREALAMDPQQRLLLESSWEAVERAGIDPATLRGSDTGVFVGQIHSDYAVSLAGVDTDVEGYVESGSLASLASGRVSYALGLQGPAITFDTACSSSLVALHMAARSLRLGECTLALAGGVTVMASPATFVEFSRRGGLSPDGRCRSFDVSAAGTGWGEGVGIIVLERLSDAVRNGHKPLAVLRGSAVNQDGASNGLTAPNGLAQQRVIRQALADAGLTPSEVDALEAHGTGTVLGDPIEAEAVIASYGVERPQPLWMGSVKSNIGHTQAAAGVAGVIKMVHAMRHGVLPRTLHLRRPNPAVDWPEDRVRLLAEPVAWPATGRPRRAAVSSFGISGTNAHVILEQPPVAAREAMADSSAGGRAAAGQSVAVPWVFSGPTPEALRAQAGRLAGYLREHVTEVDPVAAGRTLACARTAFAHRSAVLAHDHESLLDSLLAVADGRSHGGVLNATPVPGKLGVVFSGQGSQRPGMGKALYATYPVFAAALDACCAAIDPHLDRPLSDVIFADAQDQGLGDTRYAQPALFAHQVALFRLLASWGVTPGVFAGHSVGEITAAHLAGVLDLDDAAVLVCARGRLMSDRCAPGAMASLRATEAEVRDLLAASALPAGIAAVNGPRSTVVSGPPEAVADILARWKGQGGAGRILPVDRAFHSSMMEPVREPFAETIASLRWHDTQVPVVSMLTGARVTDGRLSRPDHWAEHIRQPVLFAQAVDAMVREGVSTFLEIGPDAVLTPMGEECVTEGDATWLTTANREQDETTALVGMLAGLWVRGVPVDWPAFFPPTATVDLPTYAFQRRRYWPDTPLGTASADRTVRVAEAGQDALWAAVNAGDRDAFAGMLGLEDAADRGTLDALLPALAAWRHDSAEQERASHLHYALEWRPFTPQDLASPTGRWLLVTADADDALTAAVARELGTGGTVEVVAVGPRAADEKGDSDESAVTDMVADRLRPWRGATAGTGSGVLVLPSGHGAAAVLGTLRALRDADVPGARLWVATRGAVRIDERDGLPDADQALLWGLGRVAALEQPGLWGGLVDLPERATPGALTWLRAVLRAPADEDQLAVREFGVRVRRLVRAAAPAARAAMWSPRDTVLVTGGTGGIGRRLAAWLARHGAGRVVLLSRSGESAPGTTALRAELAESGTVLVVESCDVADRAALQACLTRLRASGTVVSAVVHAAGTMEPEALATLTAHDLARSVRAKVDGARNLRDLMDEGFLDTSALDAFVLLSSVAGVWGTGGLGSYAAGNAWLDAFAERCRGEGLPATSIAYGLWEGDGMGAGFGGEAMSLRGMRALSTGLALDVLSRAVGRGQAHDIVADVTWPEFSALFTFSRPSELIADLVPDTGAPGPAPADRTAGSWQERIAGLNPADRHRYTLDLVRRHVAETLAHQQVDEISAGASFSGLGMDSMTAVALRRRLVEEIGQPLPATVVFDHPTPEALAEHLLVQASPGDPTGADAALQALDTLQRALSTLEGDDRQRRRVLARMRLIAGSLMPGVSDSAEESLEQASDDDLFTLLDS